MFVSKKLGDPGVTSLGNIRRILFEEGLAFKVVEEYAGFAWKVELYTTSVRIKM